MSPLIDVTNIVVQDINQINKESCLLEPGVSFNNELKQDKAFSISTSKSLSENKSQKVNTVISKCNNVKHMHSKRRKSKSQKEVDQDFTVTVTNEEEINNRVPPIGCDDLLFQSLATLSINEECRKTSVFIEKHIPCEDKQKCSECPSAATGFSNGSNPPSGSVSNTYKCIACGLELLSMENLTTHLIKHVYEGLYAASWLSNAMSTLLHPNYSATEESLNTSSKAQTPDTLNVAKSNSMDTSSSCSSERSSQTVGNSQT